MKPPYRLTTLFFRFQGRPLTSESRGMHTYKVAGENFDECFKAMREVCATGFIRCQRIPRKSAQNHLSVSKKSSFRR